jgi:HicB-like protein involved in pilus formation
MTPSWCHIGAMDIAPYVEQLRTELANAAELGGAEARALAERLTAPMESAFRLALLDALGSATDEITTEMAPGSVQVRLRDREPVFVVTLPPAEESMPEPPPAPPPVAESDDAVSRINLRLPDQLKARIEEAASGEGLSVNAWLVRAVSAAVQRPVGQSATQGRRRGGTGSDRFIGWAR